MLNISDIAKSVIKHEQQGIEELLNIINKNIEEIIEIIAHCEGHIIISGVGKSGNIATKIAASMSSLGIPSFFLDPSNAGHGDIGMITKHDIVITISNSGESNELMSILNYCFELEIPTIAITREEKSSIAINAKHKITIPSSKEAHEFNAPTTSTTQTLVLGDILAVCASKLKNFTKTNYAKLHPSGSLGMKISKVTTVMKHEFYSVETNINSMDILQKMTKNANGFVCVIKNEKLHGIITDGDIRRFILKNEKDINLANAEDICNKEPKFVSEEHYIIDAINTMNTNRIGSVIVVNSKYKPIGFISRTQFKI
jgi:arabinose-5-phosphate isomerase